MRSNPRSNQPLDSPWDGTLELNGQISPEASVLEIQLRHNNCSQEVNPLEQRLAREPGRSIVESYGNAPENSLENEFSGYQSENHLTESSLTQPNYMAYETDPKIDLNKRLSKSATGLDCEGSISECDSSSATGKVPNGTPGVGEQDANNTPIEESGFSYAMSGSCYYVNGRIDTCRGKFLIDTGSSISVVATEVLGKLNQKINIEPTDRKVRTANAGLLDIKGTCSLSIRLDHLTFQQEFIIADVEESLGILGVNFLDQYRADIKIKKRILKTDQGKVKLHKRGAQVCNKLQLCENVIIPAQSETLVKAYMPNKSPSSFSVLEPSHQYVDQGLLIARTLLNPSQNQMTISVLNVSDKNIKLRESTSLGTAQPVDQIANYSKEGEGEQTPSGSSGNGKFPEFLQPLLDNLSTELDSEEREQVRGLLGEFQDVFKAPDGRLSQTDLAEHFIDTGDHKPFKQPCHRIPLFKQPLVRKEVQKMLDEDVIEPSISPWNSPICLVLKKQTGEWRFCVDLRKLNSITRTDTYPLPRIDETLEKLSNSKFYSTLDMASGYWQISLNKADRPKTSFAIPGLGSFSFKVMCFGLKNAPSSFSRLMEVVLNDLQFEKCLVYLDDIIVMGRDFETAMTNLREVFLRLRQAKLHLKVSKCKLLQKDVVFLGHWISQDGITCDPDKLQVIKCWPQPKDKVEIKSFLGLVGYYHKMVPEFAEIALPLNRLTRKKAKFSWGSDQQEAFQKLKNCLLNPPILGFPVESGGSFILDVDASGSAVGGILSQYQGNQERVIAYGSHTLNASQQNYCTTKRELYSVVYFLQHFKQYLLGRKFLLRTDHAPLVWLCNFKEPSGILARWLSILGAYDYVTEYRPGRLHANADALSRKPSRPCPLPQCEECRLHFRKEAETIVSIIPGETDQVCANATENENDEGDLVSNWLNFWTKEELKQLQSQDICIQEIIRLKEQFVEKPRKNQINQVHRDIITYWNQWEVLHLHRGLLYRTVESSSGFALSQLVAPKEMREMIFSQLHEQRYAAHLGRDRTTAAIKRRFYWPGITKDISLWCKECQVCARAKPGPGRGRNALEQFKVYRPMSVVGIDIMGPLNPSYAGNQYIIVVSCYYTKWVEAFAVPNHTAATVADKLVQKVFLRLGFPIQIHSDQGREFESQLFHQLCKLLDIEKSRTTPYHPRSDGLVERFNRTLKAMLTCLVDKNQRDWDDHLAYVVAAYRATTHKSTGVSPNLLMLNREIDCPIDVMVGPPPGTNQMECPIAYVQWVQSAMQEAFEYTYEQLGMAATRQKRDYDRKLKPREYSRGNWVWRFYPPTAGAKFGSGWTGPYLVIKRVTALTYTIQKSKEDQPFPVHVDDIKPFEGKRHPKSWLDQPSIEPPVVVPHEQENEPRNQPPLQRINDSPVQIRSRRERPVKPRLMYSPE